MKKRLNMTLCFIFAISMLLTSLAGCSGDSSTSQTATGTDTTATTVDSTQSASTDPNFNATGLPIVKEKITFTLMAPQDPGNAEFDDMEMIKRQEERSNIHIDWTTVPAEMWIEKKNLTLASGDFPDGFYKAGLDDSDVITYSENGSLIDLKPLMDQYGEYIPQVLEKRSEYKEAITLTNGTIPAMCYIEDIGGMQDCQQFWYINKTWLANLGLDKPTTTDELVNVLTAFKTQDPNGNGKADEIPLSFRFQNRTDGLYYIFGSFGDVDNPLHINLHDNQTIVFSADQEGFKNGIKYLNMLYENGLLDPEGFSQDSSQYTAKARNEDEIVGSLFTWRGDNLFGVDRHTADYELLEPLKGPEGYQNWGGFLGSTLVKNTFAITKNCENPEALYRWADSLYEPKFAVTWNWGIAYEENDQGVLIPTTPPEGQSTAEYRALHTLGGYVSTAILDEYYGTVCEWQPASKWRVDTINEVYRKYMPEIVYASDNSGQPYGLTPDEVTELNTLKTEINNYVDEMTAKWITEGGVDDEWEDYLTQLQKLRLDDMIKIYQNGYDRFRGVE